MDLLCPCTNVVLTVYAHVRTEPQCDIGHTRGKKKVSHPALCGFIVSGVFEAAEGVPSVVSQDGNMLFCSRRQSATFTGILPFR